MNKTKTDDMVDNTDKSAEKTKMGDLLADEEVKKWYKKLKKASTKNAYIQGLKQYSDYHCMTPTELMNEAIEEEDAGKSMRRRSIVDRLSNFIYHLENETALSENTIASRVVGVRSFYEKRLVQLPPLELKKSGEICKDGNEIIPTKEDIRDVLKYADPLEKAVILVGVSSGMSATEISNLKIKDFHEGYDPVTEIASFELVRQKTALRFITFISPEASRAIFDYLKSRNIAKKEKLPKRRIVFLAKQLVTSDDGYLFVSRCITKKYSETQDEELRKLTPRAIFKLYEELSAKAQKDTPQGCYNFVRSHTMRKYFNTTLMNCGDVDPFNVELWMGHKSMPNMRSYFQHFKDQQFEFYKKCVKHLAITKEIDITEVDAYKKQQAIIAELKKENSQYAMQADKLQELLENNEKLGEIMRATIKEAQRKAKIFEDGSKALGLPNYFDDVLPMDRTQKRDDKKE